MAAPEKGENIDDPKSLLLHDFGAGLDVLGGEDSDPLALWNIRFNPDGVDDFSASFSLASTASIIAIVFAAADIVADAGAFPAGDDDVA